jgi:hypothetical protein
MNSTTILSKIMELEVIIISWVDGHRPKSEDECIFIDK